jgi:hypothetical protein
MSDPKRMDVIERMHSDASGVAGPNESDSPLWLNSADTVNGIVTSFLADVLVKYSAARERGDGPGFMSWLERECYQQNQVFIGAGVEDRPYLRGPWNVPDQLGQHIRIAMRIDGDNAQGVRDAFMVSARDAVNCLDASSGAPVESWGWQLDGISERLSRALLGLPPEE